MQRIAMGARKKSMFSIHWDMEVFMTFTVFSLKKPLDWNAFFFLFKPVFNFRIPHLIFCLEGICQNRREKKKKKKKVFMS